MGPLQSATTSHSYRKRADAGQHLLSILRQEAANQLGFRQRPLRTGELGGFPLTVTVSQTLGQVRVTPALDGAPGAEVTLTAADLSEADPAGLVTRLENRLGRLEANKARALAEIGNARGEIDHATASLGKPFPQAADLAAARERSRQIEDQLEAAVTPPLQQDAAPEDTPEARPTARVHNERHASPGSSAEDARERNTPARRAASPPAIAQRSRPPWPSAAERKAGPTPSPSFLDKLILVC